jgi:hypothetical protein
MEGYVMNLTQKRLPDFFAWWILGSQKAIPNVEVVSQNSGEKTITRYQMLCEWFWKKTLFSMPIKSELILSILQLSLKEELKLKLKKSGLRVMSRMPLELERPFTVLRFKIR